MILEQWFMVIILPLGAYALGSIPSGLMVTRVFLRSDIRRQGSGNIGATNVRRTVGNMPALLTLAGDVLKGALPVWLAQALVPAGPSGWIGAYWSLVAFCAVGGHLYPLYLKGRGGGKGVATTAGILLALAPAALAVSLLVFVAAACAFNRASVASLLATGTLPLIIWKTTQSAIFCVWAVLTFALIAVRHRDNLLRLARGGEPRIWND